MKAPEQISVQREFVALTKATLHLAAVLVRRATLTVIVEPLERLAKEKSNGQR